MISSAAGASSYRVTSTATTRGAPAPTSETMRFRVPLAAAESVLAEITTLPGVLEACIGYIDDYPPDDEPPMGVREPRRPHPPTGAMSAGADD